ncbi:putative membrane protein YpjA [Paenibacillus sp. SORGH_AS306]|uniref:DUF1405 domain-containing protein n=1 Tax=unclassified Paenibacillus TaxID=185978 RepID=UPI0027897499|nr:MULTISPECIES: DUF1405 domain-containing protein [unclassified Paenibacillus]MDQ1234718.1 putative membrane protein YpjA [Paenibacillus sp. SORGH_AS_0306]MDR6111763.1 putative membrane protein YpjA [Paenibacillus sp. SORGH_AS_0338]
MSISLLWSKALLTDRRVLWLLLICNAIGTVYGYIWYGLQLEYTLEIKPTWMIIFVPDSPTASLFFTVALAFILYSPKQQWLIVIRKLFEALAVVTSVKYGVWAVVMIFWGVALGDPLYWQDWMLTASHLTMAVESLLFVRFFVFGWKYLVIALAWTLLNDYMDYSQHIYPWLTPLLVERLDQVRNFTVVLTFVSALAGALALRQARKIRSFN